MPDVADRPVVKRGRRVSVLKLLGNPAFSTITVFLVENAAVTLKRLVCPRSQQADSLFVAVRNPIPAAELPGQILLRHPVAVGGHGVILQIDHIRVFRHVPYPELLFRIIPGIPVHLIITETGARLHPAFSIFSSALSALGAQAVRVKRAINTIAKLDNFKIFFI